MNRPTWLTLFTPLEDDPSPLVPILLLDAFRLARSGSSELRFAVIGCVDGELRLVPESHVHHLPKLLREAWAQVQNRTLRLVSAEQFALCTMDAFETSSGGWRMWLRTMVWVRVADAEVTLEPLHLRGEVIVSSAVARVSLTHSQTCAFDNPRAAGEVTHHWWLPAADALQTRGGRGLLLIYTMPDPTLFEGADNRAVQRRLETDIAASPSSDPLADALEDCLRSEARQSLGNLKSSIGEVHVVLESSKLVSAMQEKEFDAGTPPPPSAYSTPSQPVRVAARAEAARIASTERIERAWTSDFTHKPPPKRATQSGWWRDFAPNAIGIETLSKPRISKKAVTPDHASDFD